jgi:NADH pyrophosphatase NudC (nudix superfamily)
MGIERQAMLGTWRCSISGMILPPFRMDASGAGRYRFCPKCGHELLLQELALRERLVCAECGSVFYQNPTVGVAAILISGSSVLLARHSTNPSQWHIPSGHLEYDEDLRAGLQRELLEEAGIEISVGAVFDALSNFHSPELHTVGIWFRCEVVSGTPRVVDTDELAEVRYFALDALPPMRHATDKQVLVRLSEELAIGDL